MVVGQSTALPMSPKREKDQDFSPHPTVVVAIMVHHWGSHNQTPTLSQLLRTQHKQQHKQQMGHKATTMFHQRLWTCWSPTYQGLTPTMQLSSATWCLGWLTTTINHCPRMVPSPTDKAPNAPQFFSNWEHSGNCYRCLEGGRRNKARLSFNSEVKPTIEQIFEMYFFQEFCH